MFGSLTDIWDVGRHKLLIFVLAAKGLSGSRNVSVSITNNSSIKNTATIRRTMNPQWNELFLFQDANPQDGIQFKLLSHDDQGAVAIGELFLDFTNLPTDRPISKWFNLNTSTGESISLQLRVLRSISMETKNELNPDDSLAYEQHMASMKTGDLIAFSGIGLLPALSMMFSDAPISSLGMIVQIPNKWTKKPETFIVECSRNVGHAMDAFSGDSGPGIKLFRFEERVCEFNGCSIFWCPLKTALRTEEEQKLIQHIMNRHDNPIDGLLNLNSPIINWIHTQFGREIGGENNEQFVDLMSSSFIRECLWHCGSLPLQNQQVTPRSPMEIVRYECFNRPIPLRLSGPAGKQLLLQRQASSGTQSPLTDTPESGRRKVTTARGSRSVHTPDFNSAKLQRYEKLGSGGFGSVYRCALAGFTCAIKVLPITQNTKQMDINSVKTEVAILERARHPNIVEYLGYDFSKTELILFMEYCPFSLQGILTEKMRNPNCIVENDPREVHKFALEIVKGIAYLHNSSPPIIHRDIKTGNVLVCKDGNGAVSAVKLCDFGVAKICQTRISSANTFVGTPGLMAPEIRMGNQQAYSEKVDIWSFGILLYEMSTFSSPQLPNIWIPDGLDSEFGPLLNLVCLCLVENPAQRPTAKQLVECLALMFT